MIERINLYLDEDAQRADLIQALRARHIDVETASEAELLGQSDLVQLTHASAHNRVIFSFNRGDFFRLHTEWLSSDRHHSGIILSDQLATGFVTRRLMRLLEEKRAADMHDWLEFLSAWR